MNPNNATECEEQIGALIADAVSRAGLEVDRVSLTGRPRNTRLQIVLDLPEDQVGSADLDSLADASREISDLLDAHDPLGDEKYLLEVTTPGAERSLSRLRDVRRSRSRLASFTLVSGESFTARIIDVDAEGLLSLEVKPAKPHGKWQPRSVAFADVASGRVVLEFNRPTTEEGDE
ncbi:ribosome maturation factor RimP [Dermabacteraceae bacterium TAE3-ERU27]|nr:ribosome maturation factor RimP [Dermabacteraceae bacterium TAE3-ERU27]